MVGDFRIDGSTIVHMKSGRSVAVIETGVEDPAGMILDAVRHGNSGPFMVTTRSGKDIILLNGSNPMDALPLIRAALA